MSNKAPTAQEDFEHPRQDSSGRTADGDPTEWDRVKREHAEIVSSLNETPASFTARSAEGLPMYKGLQSHSVNGRMATLAESGHQSLAARVRASKTGRSDPNRDQGDPNDS
jgi:hypothetical protein